MSRIFFFKLETPHVASTAVPVDFPLQPRRRQRYLAAVAAAAAAAAANHVLLLPPDPREANG